MKNSPYAVGRKWFCDAARINGRPSFYFVIVGPGDKPGHKKCRLEPLPGSRVAAFGEFANTNEIHEYSHKHLKKYGVLVPQ